MGLKKYFYDLRNKEVSKKPHYLDVILCLLALSAMAIFLYGNRAVILLLTGLITGFLTEFICVTFIWKRKYHYADVSFMITGLIIALLTPASAPYWLVATATVIAIAIAKYPFGGTGNNIFNPAAVGVAFNILCWPEYMSKYPLPFSDLTNLDPKAIMYGISPESVLRVGGTPKVDYFDAFLGKFVGPMGVTCMLVLATCLFYLLVRRAVSAQIVLSSFVVMFITSALFPRVVTGTKASLIFEFCSGAFVFATIFMLNDTTTRAKTSFGKIMYGVIFAIFVIIIRRIGKVESGAVFAVLLANIFSTSCDKLGHILKAKYYLIKENKIKKQESKSLKVKEEGVLDA